MVAPSVARVDAAVRPVVESAGLELEDLVITAAGRRRSVRVVVDGADGVALDAVAEISQAVSELLDESDLMGEVPYVLEVTSPGVDRPLTEPRHWRRAIGQNRLVEVRTVGGDVFAGRPVGLSAAEDSVELSVETPPAKKGMPPKISARVLALADVDRAQVQVEFNHQVGDAGSEDEEA